jgi:hypothetical protein
MRTLGHLDSAPRLVLRAETAAELMTPNPKSIRRSATVAEATAFLSSRGISGAWSSTRRGVPSAS